ncbi:MAG: hypothetical protein WBW16_02350 [Bacteroidota bacterium]
MSNAILIVLGVILVSVFLIIATKKRWVSWRGGSGIATLTAFHDFQPKDKQHAIEIVMEQKAGKKLEEQDTGQDKKPKPDIMNLDESSTTRWVDRLVGSRRPKS